MDSLSLELAELHGFLQCPTPESWLEQALTSLPLLLIDHANCERKAAETAMALIYRYPEHDELLVKMSRLAREELHHFEQVIGIMKQRGIGYEKISAARYAASLRKSVRTYEPAALIDKLLIGAYIEARSCERFAALAPRLDSIGEHELAKFYTSLLRSEARHYQDYLALAKSIASDDISQRVYFWGELEASLITSPDPLFRFHSGLPA